MNERTTEEKYQSGKAIEGMRTNILWESCEESGNPFLRNTRTSLQKLTTQIDSQCQ